MPDLRIRRATPADAGAVAELLLASAPDMYDRFAGGRERALRLLRRAFADPGNNASAEVVWVAELEGRVAGALAAFPVEEVPHRSRAFMRVALGSLPLWRLPRALWLYWSGARSIPSPPATALYVDGLATDRSARRRGVGRALLAEAERLARERRIAAVALDTSLDNKAARALYLSEGFEEIAYRKPGHGLPGFVGLVKPLEP